MVYKKYTKKNGKVYGPYLYHNKRVGDKIVTFYHGKGKNEINLKPIAYSLLALLLVAAVIFAAYYFYNNSGVFFQPDIRTEIVFEENFKEGESIKGTISGVLSEQNPYEVSFTLTDREGARVISSSQRPFGEVAEILSDLDYFEIGSSTVEGDVRREESFSEKVYPELIVYYEYFLEEENDEGILESGQDDTEQQPSDRVCSQDSDCRANETCSNGYCVSGSEECTERSCGPGMVNPDKGSIDGGSGGGGGGGGGGGSSGGCVLNSQCRSGEICQQGQCVPQCVSNWQCGSWSNCNGYYQTRSCWDANGCGYNDSPDTVRSCNGGPSEGCFLAGTEIMTKEGPKNIEEVIVGEYVLSYNEEKKVEEYSKVSETFVHEVQDYLIINDEIEVTSNHPFYVNGNWKEAGDLKIGDLLKGADFDIFVYSIGEVRKNVEVYNIEVEGNHNYYAENILVHNKIFEVPASSTVPVGTPATTNVIRNFDRQPFTVRVSKNNPVIIKQRNGHNVRILSVEKLNGGSVSYDAVSIADLGQKGYELSTEYEELKDARSSRFSLDLAGSGMVAPEIENPSLTIKITDSEGKVLYLGQLNLEVTTKAGGAVVDLSSVGEFRAVRTVSLEDQNKEENELKLVREFRPESANIKDGKVEFVLDVEKRYIKRFVSAEIYSSNGNSRIVDGEAIFESGVIVDPSRILENTASDDTPDRGDSSGGSVSVTPPEGTNPGNAFRPPTEFVPSTEANPETDVGNGGSEMISPGGDNTIGGGPVTGAVISDSEFSEESSSENSFYTIVLDSGDSLTLYFTTAPPASVSENLPGKGVMVKLEAPEGLENILEGVDAIGFAYIPEGYSVLPGEIRVVDQSTGKPVEILGIDTDDVGRVNYVEFLGEVGGTYMIIIEIIKAEHLDSNRAFISDIYESVRELDGNWSETINDLEYVRVTFEVNLTSEKDITIFPRVVSGTPRVEVYERDGFEGIAMFENLTSNDYNKVYLTSLNGTQDTFDLRVVGGAVEFDHIIDPVVDTCAGDPTGSGIWVLNQSFSANGGTCLTISFNDVVLDGNGSVITWTGVSGAGDTPAIFLDSVNRRNITIRNLTILNWPAGIRLSAINVNVTIIDVNFINITGNPSSSPASGYGVFVNANNREIRIINSTFNSTTGYGLLSTDSRVYNFDSIGNKFIDIGSSAILVKNDSIIQGNIIINASVAINLTNGAGRNIILDNEIAGYRNSGIWISNSKDNYISGGRIIGSIESSGSAVLLEDSRTRNNTFSNLRVSNTPVDKFDLEIRTAGLNETYLLDTLQVGNYSFNGNMMIFGSSQFGNIRFLQPLITNGTNLTREVGFANSFAEVRSDLNVGLNKSANVTFTGFGSGFSNATILRDGVNCPANVCRNLTALNGVPTVVFNVTGWTNYRVVDRISNCGTISFSGEYVLTQNLNSSGNCFDIIADNVAIDGAGYTVNFSSGGSSGVFGVRSSGNNFTLKNLKIIEGSSLGNTNCGVYIQTGTGSYTFNNSVSVTSFSSCGIRTETASSNVVISENYISATGGSSAGLNLLGTGIATLRNTVNVSGVNAFGMLVIGLNSSYFQENIMISNGSDFYTSGISPIKNLSFVNQYISKYNFTKEVEDVKFVRPGLGEIKFLVPLNGSGTNLSRDYEIKDNFALVRSSLNPGLNKPANITLYNIGERNFVGITILKDGFGCGGACYNFTPLNATNVVFNVTNWSFYSIGGTVDNENPLINFTNPTPENGTVIILPNNSFAVNMSIYDTSQIYSFIDVNNDVFLWMRMDDVNSSGDPIDSSFYSLNGTRYGRPNQTSQGYFGKAFSFNGTTDYIKTEIIASGKSRATSVAVSAWVYTKGNKNSTIVAHNYIGGAGYKVGWGLTTNESGQVNMVFRSSGSSYQVGTSLPIGEWHHIVGQRDSGEKNVEVYIDGIRVAVGNGGEEDTYDYSQKGFEIGGGAFSGDRFNGSIDEVMIFDRFLTPTEINHLYHSGNNYFKSFDDAPGGLYRYTGYAVDRFGNRNKTEERVVTIILDCGVLDQPGAVYKQYSNVASNGTCFEIVANNIVLDGNGYNLSYSANGTVGYGVLVNGSNGSIIRNLIIREGTVSGNAKHGVYLTKTNNTYLNNNYIVNRGVDSVAVYSDRSAESDFLSNTIFVNGTRGDGISINNSYGNYIYGNNVNVSGTGASALRFLGNESHNLVYSNTLSSQLQNHISFPSSQGAANNNTFNSNTLVNTGTVQLNISKNINETYFINQQILGYSIRGNITNAVFRNSLYGEIRFLQAVNGSGTSLSNDVRVQNNSVSVNSNVAQGFNKSANITIYGANLFNFAEPDIFRDGIICPANVCSNYTALNATNAIFSVAGWTNYSIEDKSTAVTLIAPVNSNLTYNRIANFNWTSGPVDYYEFNLTFVPGSGSCTDQPERFVTGITTMNYTLTQPLNCFYDSIGGNNGHYYRWKVRAFGNGKLGQWSEEWKLNLTSLIDISLNNSIVNFSNINIFIGDNTTDNNPRPFVLENKGNIKVNVTVNASRLWLSYPNNESNIYYQYKADNYTLTPGYNVSFNRSLSPTAFTPMSSASNPKLAVAIFNWTKGSNLCEIDILLAVPPTEPVGQRNSSVTFIAGFGE